MRATDRGRSPFIRTRSCPPVTDRGSHIAHAPAPRSASSFFLRTPRGRAVARRGHACMQGTGRGRGRAFVRAAARAPCASVGDSRWSAHQIRTGRSIAATPTALPGRARPAAVTARPIEPGGPSRADRACVRVDATLATQAQRPQSIAVQDAPRAPPGQMLHVLEGGISTRPPRARAAGSRRTSAAQLSRLLRSIEWIDMT